MEIDYTVTLAAAVAIILFVVKEFGEWFRKQSERSRKTGAIKLLLTEEIERNHWALMSLFGALGQLDKWPRTALTLRVARNGSERLSIKPEDECDSRGLPMPRFCTAMYERLLPPLAELDKALFEIVRTTYEKIGVLPP